MAETPAQPQPQQPQPQPTKKVLLAELHDRAAALAQNRDYATQEVFDPPVSNDVRMLAQLVRLAVARTIDVVREMRTTRAESKDTRAKMDRLLEELAALTGAAGAEEGAEPQAQSQAPQSPPQTPQAPQAQAQQPQESEEDDGMNEPETEEEIRRMMETPVPSDGPLPPLTAAPTELVTPIRKRRERGATS